MKLIRLTTDNPNGEFDINFKSDIMIGDNSKIALQNVSINTSEDIFTVDSGNNTILFTIGGNLITATLDASTYNKDDYQDLIDDITLSLNSSISLFSGKLLGIQFLTLIDTSGKVSISFRSSPYALMNSPNMGGAKRGVVSDNALGTFYKSANIDSTIDDSMFYSTKQFIKGQGVFRAYLSRFNDTGQDNGFIIGLSDVEPTNWGEPSLSEEQKTYSINITRPTANGGTWNYLYKDEDGVMTTGSLDIANTINLSDLMEISVSNGQIRAKIYKNIGGAILDLFSIAYDNTTALYPFMSFRSRGSALRVANVRVQLDPYQTDTNAKLTSYGDEDNTNSALFNIPRPSPQLSVNSTLTFQNRVITDFLGFNKQTLTNSGVNHNFIADNRFSFSIFNDTLIIVLESLELESYDGFDGDRKNILAVIPVSDNNPSRIIQYEPNTLNFIELKNIKSQSIRGIKGRILLADLKQPSLKGLSTITLLIH